MRQNKVVAVDQIPVAQSEIFDDFKIDLTELKPEVREKAITLAKEMMNQGIQRDQAIIKGIQEAETWFLESQG